MKCPFELPIEKEELNLEDKKLFGLKNAEGTFIYPLTEDEADYIVQAINSYEKLSAEIQVIISRLERNRNAERLNSESTKEPSKSFWRGQADKASEVIIWLEQALEAEKK